MAHDFNAFPELSLTQLQFYYFESPHKQIFEDFKARVVKVHDGDTVTLRWQDRDFDFPLRMSNLSARELTEKPSRDTSHQICADGKTSQKWLENKILNQEVDILINPSNKVDKFGRLLGQIMFRGINIGEESQTMGMGVSWEKRDDGKITKLELMKFE